MQNNCVAIMEALPSSSGRVHVHFRHRRNFEQGRSTPQVDEHPIRQISQRNVIVVHHPQYKPRGLALKPWRVCARA